MVRLIKFELKKHFIKRSLLIVLFVLSILDIAKINMVYQESSNIAVSTSPTWYRVFWQLYDEFSGTMTKEKIDQLLSVYRPLEQQTADLTASRRMNDPNTYTGNVFSDYYLLTGYYIQPMEYAYMYRSVASDIVRKAQENMAFYNKLGNKCMYRENRMITKLFAGRSITRFSYTEMYQYYLEYDFSSVLVMLFCLYGLVGVFVMEKETQMDMLLMTTVSGGRKTVITKIIASILFIFAVSLWFWLLDFTAFSAVFHSLEAAASPVYALANFENASVNLTMSQYAIVSAAIKTGGMMVLGLVFLFVSSVSQNALLPFVVNMVLSGAVILHQEIMEGSEHILFKIINPFILVANSELFKKTEFIHIFNIPVLSYIAALISATLICVIFILLIVFTTRKNAIVERR